MTEKEQQVEDVTWWLVENGENMITKDSKGREFLLVRSNEMGFFYTNGSLSCAVFLTHEMQAVWVEKHLGEYLRREGYSFSEHCDGSCFFYRPKNNGHSGPFDSTWDCYYAAWKDIEPTLEEKLIAAIDGCSVRQKQAIKKVLDAHEKNRG